MGRVYTYRWRTSINCRSHLFSDYLFYFLLTRSSDLNWFSIPCNMFCARTLTSRIVRLTVWHYYTVYNILSPATTRKPPTIFNLSVSPKAENLVEKSNMQKAYTRIIYDMFIFLQKRTSAGMSVGVKIHSRHVFYCCSIWTLTMQFKVLYKFNNIYIQYKHIRIEERV